MRPWVTNWLLSTLSLLLAAWIVPGIQVRGLLAALAAAALIGFLNATIGLVLKILTLPLTVVTLGLFLMVVNALMFWLAAAIVPGFSVRSFWSALLGALLMSLTGILLRRLMLA
jgi:putative membrane protein